MTLLELILIFWFILTVYFLINIIRPFRPFNRRIWPTLIVFVIFVTPVSIFLVFGNLRFSSAPMIVQAVPWAGRDANIILDHHTHTKFSDGALTPGALVDLALKSGCNAIVYRIIPIPREPSAQVNWIALGSSANATQDFCFSVVWS